MKYKWKTKRKIKIYNCKPAENQMPRCVKYVQKDNCHVGFI